MTCPTMLFGVDAPAVNPTDTGPSGSQFDVTVSGTMVVDGAPISTLDVGASLRPKLPGWLVHLRTTMGIGGTRSGAALTRPSDDGVDRLRKRLAKLVARVESDNEADADLLAEARAIGDAVVGRPLLASSAFVEALGEERACLVSMGKHSVKGVGDAIEVFTDARPES